MRKKTIAIVALVLICMVFTLLGCEKGKENVDNGLKVGFEVSSGDDPSPSDFCAYSSEVSEFDINDVTLEFFYGGIFSENIEVERIQGRHIGKVKLFFHNPALGKFDILNHLSYENLYFIKESEEDYTSEAHRWKGNLYEEGEGEIITIPKELFVGESGVIGFLVFGKDEKHRDYPDIEYERVSGKSIYYKVNGDRVMLSGEEIKE
ncbi:hypothetical protein EOM82_03560 [bacterium]|nr:hypothetical protein [bacterium]